MSHQGRVKLLSKRVDSAVCCSKMSCDAFLSEALYKADNALEKFTAAPRECGFHKIAKGADGESQMCFILLFCVISYS